MKNIALALRSFFKNDQNSIIKTISLGAGLAMGLILISKIYFEQSYDNFHPDKDRIYQISTNYSMNGSDPSSFGNTSGGVAVGMKAEIPSVEVATRFTSIEGASKVFTPDKNRYTAHTILADSSLFEILPRKMISGNAKQTLSQPMYAIISEKTAKALGKGGDPVGQTFMLEGYPDKPVTIGGVFEDIPENSHLEFDIIISFCSISSFLYDGSSLWFGNERYNSYVKLIQGTTPESIADDIIKTQLKYQDPEELKKYGISISFSLIPITSVHSQSPENRRINIMLAMIAFALLLTSSMNYVLIVISSLVKRGKEIAIYKCYGSSNSNITKRIMSETLISLLFALLFAGAAIILLRQDIQSILQVEISSLFSAASIGILLMICVLVFLITGAIPSYIFSQVPISSAFKHNIEARRSWKQILLLTQFIMASFLVALLFIVVKQYDLMTNSNPGYSYQNSLYIELSGTSSQQRTIALERIKEVQGVTSVASCTDLPMHAGSGNNVSEIGSEKHLFNFCDLYNVDADYIPLMEIKITQGRSFSREYADSASVIVSDSFAKKISEQLGWRDGVIGKTLKFTEHGNCTMIGTYNDIRVRSIADADNRPTAMFYSEEIADIILIKTRELNNQQTTEIGSILKEIFPQKSIDIIPFHSEMINLYADSLRFSNSVLIGGMIVFIISIMGLIGYTSNEITRRSKEISIRKINGSTALGIIKNFAISISKLAFPSVIIGSICSYIAGEIWLKQFSEKISTQIIITICAGSALLVLIIAILCTLIKTWHVANENPIKRLKNE